MKLVPILLLLLCLLGCSVLASDTAVTSPQVKPPTTEASLVATSATVPQPTQAPSVFPAFQAVIAGASFQDSFSGIKLSLAPEDNTISDAFGRTTEPYRFLLLDLDADSREELILWLKAGTDYSAGYWVLRWEQGHVMGYNLSYFMLDRLKADGTFCLSASPEDYGAGRLLFLDGDWSFQYDLHYKAALDGNGQVAQYFATVAAESVTEDVFLAAYETQLNKEDALWLDFTKENLSSQGLR